LKNWIKDKQMASLTRHAQRESVSPWSRVCRWQVGMLTGRPAVLAGLPLLLYFFLLTWMTGTTRGMPLVSFPIMFVSFVPAGFVGMSLWQRRLFVLPRESLLCVDRPTYLKQVGMAAMLNQFQLWLGMVVLLLVWWQWAASELPAIRIAYTLAFSALLQPALFGVCVWILRLRSRMLVAIVAMVVFQVAVFSAVFAGQMDIVSKGAVVLLVAAIFAVLGLVLTWDGYRRWLVTDFD
jgi:hypothetical protein